MGSHYAALVLFQDATLNKPLKKPSVSSTGLSYTDPILREKLSCQEVPPRAKPMVRSTLPPDMFLHPENKQATCARHADCPKCSCKAGILDQFDPTGHVSKRPSYLGCSAHTCLICCRANDACWVPSSNDACWLPSSNDACWVPSSPMMLVGFLPVIPKPITERATVRHCLTNFQSVRRQLNQESMAIWCDKGVFAPSADVYLEETDKFKDLFLGLRGLSIGLAFYSGVRAICFEVLGR